MMDLEDLERTIMPFGRYKGQPLDTVPLKYLDWLAGESERLYGEFRRRLYAYLRHPTIRAELEREMEGE